MSGRGLRARRPWWAWIGIALLCIAASACGSPTPSVGPTESGGAVPADPAASTPDASAEAAVARIERLLDPKSRDLLTVVAPEESIEATIGVADPAAVGRAGTASGLHTEVVSVDEVLIVGPVAAVLEFVATTAPTTVAIAEDHRADRWLPATLPSVLVPTPGTPYRVMPLQVDRSKLTMTPQQQVGMLRTLAASIVTIDGAPYDRILAYGECSGRPPSCFLSAQGLRSITGGREDQYLVTVDPTTGDVPRLDSMILGAVPRDMARAAEWIARHDPGGAAAIAAYDSCCTAEWDPARPGVVRMIYTRPCAASVAPVRVDLAATGDCFDTVAIVVDLGSGTVVSMTPKPGP